MIPEAYLVHSITERARIRIPSKRYDTDYFRVLEERLGKCPGVHAVQTNPLVGSVLVLYSGDPVSIVSYAREHELFTITSEGQSAKPVTERVLERVQVLDEQVQAASGGSFDLNGAFFVGLTCASVVQLLRRSVWPNGVTLLWYAANVLRQSRRGQNRRT